MTRDKDEDLIALKKRIITGLLVGIAVVIPAVFCFGYRFRHDVKSAYYKIRRQDSFVLFLYDSKNCSNCQTLKKNIKSRNVDYVFLDVENKDQYGILKQEISLYDDIDYPVIVYIDEGKVSLFKENISNSSEIDAFLEDLSLVE